MAYEYIFHKAFSRYDPKLYLMVSCQSRSFSELPFIGITPWSPLQYLFGVPSMDQNITIVLDMTLNYSPGA